jgi:hypothetical protein
MEKEHATLELEYKCYLIPFGGLVLFMYLVYDLIVGLGFNYLGLHEYIKLMIRLIDLFWFGD